MCPGTQNRKTDLNSLSLLRNKAWQACSTSEKQQLVKPTGEKRTHCILRRKTLLVNHHRRALRAGHSSTWRHFLQLTLRTEGCCQPTTQRNPKLKETIQCHGACYRTRLLRLLGGGVKGYSCIAALLIRVLLEIEPCQPCLRPQECRQGDKEAAADRRNMPGSLAQLNILITQSPSWVTPMCISSIDRPQKKTLPRSGGK